MMWGKKFVVNFSSHTGSQAVVSASILEVFLSANLSWHLSKITWLYMLVYFWILFTCWFMYPFTKTTYLDYCSFAVSLELWVLITSCFTSWGKSSIILYFLSDGLNIKIKTGVHIYNYQLNFSEIVETMASLSTERK